MKLLLTSRSTRSDLRTSMIRRSALCQFVRFANESALCMRSKEQLTAAARHRQLYAPLNLIRTAALVSCPDPTLSPSSLVPRPRSGHETTRLYPAGHETSVGASSRKGSIIYASAADLHTLFVYSLNLKKEYGHLIQKMR